MSGIGTEKHIDMTSVGCLVAVNIDRHKGCQHHPNTDTPWEFGETALTVLPDISWEEWSTLWSTVSGLHRRSLWYVGDCLRAGEGRFGEQYAQVVDGYAPETTRVAKWVAERIEPGRRRAALSWSAHRECAALDPAEQDELLAQAEAESWRTADMKAAVKERKEAAKSCYPGNGPADDHDDDRRGDTADGPEAPSVEAADAEGETLSDSAPEASPACPAPPLAIAGPVSIVDELRSCIEAVRAVAFDLALGTADPSAASALSMRILKAMGRQLTSYSRIPLLSTEEAQALIPDNYTIKKTGGMAVNGPRQWAVELRGPAGELAVATGPHEPAAMIEVAIAAHLQAVSEPFAPSENGIGGFQFRGGGEPT